MKNIYVIIVTYNAMKWADRCFRSLRESSIPLHTIVVDNGSSDGTVDYINNTFSEINLICNRENLGFGKANNIGIEIALNNKADYVFLLNQDAWIFPKTIERLIVCKEDGIISPVHLEANMEHLNKSFAASISSSCLMLEEDFLVGNVKKYYSVDTINAAAWLISKETLLKIGGFDPIFFHYGEDVNYGQRIRFHNLGFYFVPDSYICHDMNYSKSLLFKKYETRHNLLINIGNLNKKEIITGFLGFLHRFMHNFFYYLFHFNFNQLRYMLIDIFFVLKILNKILANRKINSKIGPHWLYN